MNNAYKVLRILKWACFPLGWIMYMATEGVVVEVLQVALATAAIVSFWLIVRKEESRQMEKSIAEVIQGAISAYSGAGYAVEVQRIRSGAVARVYVFGEDDRTKLLLDRMKSAVSEALHQHGLEHRVWILQLTTVAGEEDIPARREELNQVMFRELSAIQKRREHADDKDETE